MTDSSEVAQVRSFNLDNTSLQIIHKLARRPVCLFHAVL